MVHLATVYKYHHEYNYFVYVVKKTLLNKILCAHNKLPLLFAQYLSGKKTYLEIAKFEMSNLDNS